MTLFLLSFFTLYGLAHLYAFLKAKAAFAFGIGTGIVIALFMVFMTSAPVIIHLSENVGWETFARFLSFTAYVWMGVLFLFLSASAVIDIYRFILSGAGRIAGSDFSSLTIAPRRAFFVPLVVSLAIAVYGYFEAKNVRLERITIETTKLPAGIDRLNIVQISDVHLGLIVRDERWKEILDEVKKAQPDILVSTGDLVDGQINRLSGLAEMVKEIRPRFGTYAITGNHEFYAGLGQALVFTEKAGFTMLRGEGLSGEVINIAGVDDRQAKTFGAYKGKPEKEILKALPREKFTLLLKHRPLVDGESLGLFDLQLSGHVHRGQIFPFSIITGLYYPVQAGYAEMGQSSKLYVSRGSGTWGPPIRFLSPPEVTLIEIVKKGKS